MSMLLYWDAGCVWSSKTSPSPHAASECERTSTSPKDLLISLPTSVLLMQDGIRIQKKKQNKKNHCLITSYLQQQHPLQQMSTTVHLHSPEVKKKNKTRKNRVRNILCDCSLIDVSMLLHNACPSPAEDCAAIICVRMCAWMGAVSTLKLISCL